MIDAVIIDIDDTLCLTEAACFEMENETLLSMGLKPMDRGIHLKTWGQPLFEAIKLRSPGISVEGFKAAYHPIIANYIKYGKLDKIPTENYNALDILKSQGKLLFILTSRTHVELKHMLEPDHKLAELIKEFYYKDNMRFHKPDPRAFRELIANNDLIPENCVYVGDSLSDATSSKAAGLKFIACSESGLREPSEFDPEQVDAFIYKFSELVDAVSQLESN